MVRGLGRGRRFALVVFVFVFGLLSVPLPVQGQEVSSALGIAFLGVDGFDEWESGVAFVAALHWGAFWLFDFQAVPSLRAFGLHAGWKLSPAWLAVGLRVVNEEGRRGTKTLLQVGARAGAQFDVVGLLSWYNEAGVYAPLGEKGKPQPFVALGFSLSF